MDWVLYVKVFAVGGLLCAMGQLLLSLTRLTTARILVIYVTAGVVLGGLGVYGPLVDWAGAGATVPLTGFGYALSQGAKKPSVSRAFWGPSPAASPPRRGASPPPFSLDTWSRCWPGRRRRCDPKARRVFTGPFPEQAFSHGLRQEPNAAYCSSGSTPVSPFSAFSRYVVYTCSVKASRCSCLSISVQVFIT